MDGVIVDFNGEYYKRYDIIARHDPDINKHWFEAVDNDIFRKAPKMPDADVLLDFVFSTNKDVQILSSLSHRNNHHQVRLQKIDWLYDHGLGHLIRNFVHYKSEKSEYAFPKAILIDDSKECINPFNKKGGRGILHVNAEQTIIELKQILNL